MPGAVNGRGAESSYSPVPPGVVHPVDQVTLDLCNRRAGKSTVAPCRVGEGYGTTTVPRLAVRLRS